MGCDRHEHRAPCRLWSGMLGAAVLAAILTLAGVWVAGRVAGFMSIGDEPPSPPPRESMDAAPGPDNTHTTMPAPPQPT